MEGFAVMVTYFIAWFVTCVYVMHSQLCSQVATVINSKFYTSWYHMYPYRYHSLGKFIVGYFYVKIVCDKIFLFVGHLAKFLTIKLFLRLKALLTNSLYNYTYLIYIAITCFTQTQTMEYKRLLCHCIVYTYKDTYFRCPLSVA